MVNIIARRRDDQQAPQWPSHEAVLDTLLPWMYQRRWFPLKDAKLSDLSIRVVQCVELDAMVRDYVVEVSQNSPKRHALLHVPLCCENDEIAQKLAERHREHRRDAIMVKAPGCWLVDGVFSTQFWTAWAVSVAEEGTTVGGLNGLSALVSRALSPRVTTGEQSNTSVIFRAEDATQSMTQLAQETFPHEGDGDDEPGDLIVKIFRVVDSGRNPDVELPVALARAGWDRVPRPFAFSTLALPVSAGDDHECCSPDPAQDDSSAPSPQGDDATHHPCVVMADSAVGCEFITGARDGFTLMTELASANDIQTAYYLASDLGQITADMHRHLAHAMGTAPAPQFTDFVASTWKRVQWAVEQAPVITDRTPGMFDQIEELLDQVNSSTGLPQLSRIHGDYHLGQVLYGDDGWFVLDFEGEPLRPLAERTLPDIPAKDAAGMLRSFDYAFAVSSSSDHEWLVHVRDAFLTSYRRAMNAHGVEVTTELLAVLEIDKALYEVVYEARNRPDWIEIPLDGLHRALDVTRP